MFDFDLKNVSTILVGVSMGLGAAAATTVIVSPKKEGDEPASQFETLGVMVACTAVGAAAGVAIDTLFRKL